jgi:DNA ligase 1
VLDGEIIAYAEGRRLIYFDLQTRLGRTRHESDLFLGEAVPVIFVVFDLLWKNGRVLTETTLANRRTILEQLRLPACFQLAEVHRAQNREELDAIFAAACARGHEGIVAKDPESHYLPGLRGRAWLKLKKAGQTLEVVVVQAQPGSGKRAHVLSDLTLAVRDERNGELKIIGKAHSGLSDEEIEELTEHFRSHTLSLDDDVHTVEPKIVLEVAFESIQSNKKNSSGLALRFARIRAIRWDKSVAEIDTLKVVWALAQIQNEVK